MKLIKLNNTQANKLTGIYNNIWAIDPLHVEDNFWVIKVSEDLNNNYGILKRYLEKLSGQGRISIIDMSMASPERTKIRAAFKKETRINQIEYRGKHIIGEL